MRKPEDYKHIAAWGRHLHRPAEEVAATQARACADNAPLDAVYETQTFNGAHSHQWIRAENICSPWVKATINRMAARL